MKKNKNLVVVVFIALLLQSCASSMSYPTMLEDLTLQQSPIAKVPEPSIAQSPVSQSPTSNFQSPAADKSSSKKRKSVMSSISTISVFSKKNKDAKPQ